MRQISFKQRFIAPILDGTKRQTLRTRTTVETGDLALARCRYDRPAFARLRILGVERTQLGDLTERDAIADGLASLADMRQLWGRMYPDEPWRSDRRVFRIHFKLET